MKKYSKLLFIGMVAVLTMQAIHAQDAVVTDEVDPMLAPDAPEATDSTAADETASANANQIYVIRQGDTMWDICKITLDNPWYWPKLWSLNQYILNPNLIYPGNRLVFSPATDTSFPRFEVVAGDEDVDAVSAEVEPAAKSEPVVQAVGSSSFLVEESRLRKGESLGVKLRAVSFVNPDDLDTIGKIASSVEPKSNLVFGDKMYIRFYSNRDVKIGDKFQVIEKVKMVFDPDRETKKIGQLVKKKATITVTHIVPDKRWRRRVVEATYADGDDPVLRDDELIPYETNIRSLIPHFTDKDIYGKIVEADSEQFLISNNDFVFLNIGKRNGIQPGLQMYVVRRGDGLEENTNDEDFPDVPIARILVVETFEKTATAYVTTLDRPLAVGDRIRSKLD